LNIGGIQFQKPGFDGAPTDTYGLAPGAPFVSQPAATASSASATTVSISPLVLTAAPTVAGTPAATSYVGATGTSPSVLASSMTPSANAVSPPLRPGSIVESGGDAGSSDAQPDMVFEDKKDQPQSDLSILIRTPALRPGQLPTNDTDMTSWREASTACFAAL